MKNRIFYALAAAAALGMVGTASADTTTVLTPGDLVNKPAFGIANPYGWDWDEGAPIGSTTVGGAPGFSGGSWYSDVDGSASGVGRDYTALRINVQGMFGLPSVTIADLDEISYWTNMTSGTVDWQLKIYTFDTVPGGSTWYGHRFNFNRPNFGAGSGWNKSSTSTNLNTNWITYGATGAANNDYNPHSLSYLNTNFGTEQILFIDIIASYMTSSPPVHSYLDGVSIKLKNGTTNTLNLEAAVVPIPGAAGLGLLGMGIVGYMRRRKNAVA